MSSSDSSENDLDNNACGSLYTTKQRYVTKKGEEKFYSVKRASHAKRRNRINDSDILDFIQQNTKNSIGLDDYLSAAGLAVKSFKEKFIAYILANSLLRTD